MNIIIWMWFFSVQTSLIFSSLLNDNHTCLMYCKHTSQCITNLSEIKLWYWLKTVNRFNKRQTTIIFLRHHWFYSQTVDHSGRPENWCDSGVWCLFCSTWHHFSINNVFHNGLHHDGFGRAHSSSSSSSSSTSSGEADKREKEWICVLQKWRNPIRTLILQYPYQSSNISYLLAPPSSSLLYSAISISSRVLMSNSILYSWDCLSMSALSRTSCSSRLVTRDCSWVSCME